MIQKERINANRSTQDIERLINKLTSGKPFILKNLKEKRDIDIKNASLDDVAQILGTLLSDLQTKGIIQK